MKSRIRNRVPFRFDCFKKGHEPYPFVPEHQVQMGDMIFQGCVCRKCWVVYYEPIGHPSGLISATGREVVVGS